MSRENQFHGNPAEMWLKGAHLWAGATQQSLLLGIPGTFQKPPQTAASWPSLGGREGAAWDFWEPSGSSLRTLILSDA